MTSLVRRRPFQARLLRNFDPELLGFAVSEHHAEDLALAIGVDAHRDDHGDLHDVVAAPAAL